MARTLAEIEAAIGVPPGTYPATANPQDLKDWLHLKGVPAFGLHSTEGSSLHSLRTGYSSARYLAGWIKNARNGTSTSTPATGKAKLRQAQALLNLPTDSSTEEVSNLDFDEAEPLNAENISGATPGNSWAARWSCGIDAHMHPTKAEAELCLDQQRNSIGLGAFAFNQSSSNAATIAQTQPNTPTSTSGSMSASQIAAAVAPIIKQALAAERQATNDLVVANMLKAKNDAETTARREAAAGLQDLATKLRQELKVNPRDLLGSLIQYLPSSKRAEDIHSNSNDSQLDLDLDHPSSTSAVALSQSSSPYVPVADPNFYFDPKATAALITCFKLSHNAMLIGPAGCGKTQLPLNLCAKLNLGALRVNCNGDVSYKDFIGTMNARQGETFFTEGILPKAMRLGLKLVLDEVDYMPPHIAALFNPVAEHGGKLYIPETGEYVSPALGFCIVATANTGGKGDRMGQFTGTEVLNTAFLDRYSCVMRMTYLPPDREHEMIANRYPALGMEDRSSAWGSELFTMIRLATEVRAAFERGELAITLSTRKLIDYFAWRQEGHTQTQALESCLLNWFDADDEGLVKTILDRLDIKLDPKPNP